ncbi:hypothetical protein BD414DRAFT_535475 [Trametes punicea]|nr:hypothetical protein BD414DRAFT_541423 [Trametes punicea]KAI8992880.1 hypothetical protein BD414DRAFT_535475 [Trametes punicea]
MVSPLRRLPGKRQASSALPSNTVTYNVCAACAVCQGENIPSWADWADENDCGSNPQPFPSHVALEQGTIPDWAYQRLSNNNDFDLGAAIASAGSSSAGGSSKASVATRVAVPIATGVGVAIVAILAFWLYSRRKRPRHLDPRTKSLPVLPGAQSHVWRPWSLLYTLWPSTRSRRLRPSKKGSDWAIDDDDDTQWLGHSHQSSQSSNLGVNASYRDPFAHMIAQGPLRAEPASLGPAEQEVADVLHTSAHIPETSSSTLLPHSAVMSHVELPAVRAPTLVERFARLVLSGRGGLRKSPTYKSKHVSPVSPDPHFRIDGSAGPTPVEKDFVMARSSRVSTSGASSSASAKAAGLAGAQRAATERSDFEPQSDGSVLLISRDGRDFSLDDTMTTAAPSQTGSPRSASTFRQASSGRSGTRTNTSSSWLPSPNRANTASTTSGAYPSELRRDPDLASPRSWASRFPAPPHTFAESPPSTAFRSLSNQMRNPPAYDPGPPSSDHGTQWTLARTCED